VKRTIAPFTSAAYAQEVRSALPMTVDSGFTPSCPTTS
jgi:hypothetical protein